MKILFLIRSLEYGGAERQLVILAKGLQAMGHTVSVAVWYVGGPLDRELLDARIAVIDLGKKGRWDVVRFLIRLFRMVRAHEPDILHGYLPLANLLTILPKAFQPSLKAVWGVRASYLDLDRYDWLERLVFRTQCLLARFADLIIANSYAASAHHLQFGFPREKMVVIPNGIDTKSFARDSDGRSRLRATWRIGEDKVLIGVVGRLDPMKDHSTFLGAAALLIQQRAEARFVCVGGGSNAYTAKLHALSRHLGLERHVVWAGQRKDMATVYSALDIVCSSSFGESFQNTIGEAMACGVPCLVTDVGDAAYIVGDTGIVVPPRNPEALATGLARMAMRVADEQPLLSQRARERIVDQFSVDRLVKKTVGALAGRL